MQGRRLPDGFRIAEAQPGDYWRQWRRGEESPVKPGDWFVCTPNGISASVRKHSVTEYEDGTITVAPPILVEQPPERRWHGFLERGVWREA